MSVQVIRLEPLEFKVGDRCVVVASRCLSSPELAGAECTVVSVAPEKARLLALLVLGKEAEEHTAFEVAMDGRPPMWLCRESLTLAGSSERGGFDAIRDATGWTPPRSA